MKSRETLIRLKRFQVDDKRRRVAQIEMMIADFERMANELDREIKAEEARSGINDTSHFAYPTYARAAKTRRDNLQQSADNLKGQLDEAKIREWNERAAAYQRELALAWGGVPSSAGIAVGGGCCEVM
jgi:flagellar export protein FliJ